MEGVVQEDLRLFSSQSQLVAQVTKNSTIGLSCVAIEATIRRQGCWRAKYPYQQGKTQEQEGWRGSFTVIRVCCA